MRFEILDHKVEKNSDVYLCKMTLSEYLSGLKHDYNDYEIQRGIVKNVYLDRLIETVMNSGHIPIITLVTDEEIYKESRINITGSISSFDILDGLQRTYRLKNLFDTMTLCKNVLESQNLTSSSISNYEISKLYSNEVKELNSSMKSLLRFIEYSRAQSFEKLYNCFDKNYQWFEIWTNLDSNERVNKMLTLNAGHRPVTLKHQLELLFINMLPQIKETNPLIEIVRDKDKSSRNRNKYSFEFSNLISSSLSFHEGKTVVPNQDMILSLMEDRTEISSNITWEFIEQYIIFLQFLDDHLFSSFGEIGIQWLGRDTVINGLFAALGEYAKKNSMNFENVTTMLKLRIMSNPALLNINEFERIRNNLDLSRINVGSIMRRTTYKGIYDFLNDKNAETVSWVTSHEKSEVE